MTFESGMAGGTGDGSAATRKLYLGIAVQPDRETVKVLVPIAFEVASDTPREVVEREIQFDIFRDGTEQLGARGWEYTGDNVALEGPLPPLEVAAGDTPTGFAEQGEGRARDRYRLWTTFYVDARTLPKDVKTYGERL